MNDLALLDDPRLAFTAKANGTPAFVYDLALLEARYRILESALMGAATIRYAIKANPHPSFLTRLARLGACFDASSIGEIKRALAAGARPDRVSFTGPGKSAAEIEAAVDLGIRPIVIESLHQAQLVAAAADAREIRQPVVLRIDPAAPPRKFGARMTGAGSQFGVEEAQAAEVLRALAVEPGLAVEGIHIYNASNALDPDAIARNLHDLAELTLILQSVAPFSRAILGFGLGLPYHEGQMTLPLDRTVRGTAEALLPLKKAGIAVDLELGRWLAGPAGALLTKILDLKQSGEKTICVCDAGFHSHLAAAGLMGSVLRRNWPIRKLGAEPRDQEIKVTLAGPLCTSIDVLARDLLLPAPRIGDVLSIGLSGAYGPTASPTSFISHPPPAEIVLDEAIP